MRPRLFGLLAALLCIAATPTRGAEPTRSTRVVPTVIYDAGGVPIGDYLENVVPETQAGDPRPPSGVPAVPPIFPVVTAQAKPGLLGAPVRGKLKGGPGMPLCIIGDDSLSDHWLNLNLTKLQQMQAACLVVSVRDEAAFRRLQARLGSVLLAPGSFDALAEASGIRVWPVLVSPDGLVSQ